MNADFAPASLVLSGRFTKKSNEVITVLPIDLIHLLYVHTVHAVHCSTVFIGHVNHFSLWTQSHQNKLGNTNVYFFEHGHYFLLY